MPLVSRTRATFRSAEFGFFGVRVITWRQTPRRCGAPRPALVVCLRVLSVRRSAGAFTFLIAGFRPLRTSWLMVGNENLAESRTTGDRWTRIGPERRPWRSRWRADIGLPPGPAIRSWPGAHTKASR